jgi:DNA-binding NtrC family response regulator
MSKLFPISRWLVVDDAPDDVEDIVLAIEGLGGKVDTADSIKAAEKLLKKNIYDACIIDCFYKGSTKCGIDLLPDLRATLPGLPVIMMSSSDDLELPGKVIRAGADVFCPKIKDSFCLTKMIGAAAIQAIAIRKLKVLEYSPKSLDNEIFISKQTSDAMEHSIRRKDERLLICGASGTGKTKTAQKFADQFLKQNYGAISRNIVYHNCALHSDEVNAQLLFGNHDNDILKSQSTLQLTLFERAVGGVLILDDIHALSHENQRKLKNIFDAEITSSSAIGDSVFALNLMKCVATCSTSENFEIVPGFLESYSHREIDLPAISELNHDFKNAIEFILDHFFSSQQEIKVTYQNDAIDKILDLASHHHFPANFRTLRQMIENALTRALVDGRSQIYACDIEIIGSMKSAVGTASGKNVTRSNIEALNGRFGEVLLRHISAGENFDQAKDVLRKIMIQIASKKYSGNKSKIAASLGISRQSLYDHEFQ